MHEAEEGSNQETLSVGHVTMVELESDPTSGTWVDERSISKRTDRPPANQ